MTQTQSRSRDGVCVEKHTVIRATLRRCKHQRVMKRSTYIYLNFVSFAFEVSWLKVKNGSEKLIQREF